jgi:hypothetical protein
MPKGIYNRPSDIGKRISRGMEKSGKGKGFHSSPRTEFKRGKDNPFWKGGGYKYIHFAVRRIKPKTPCEMCGARKWVDLVFKDHSAGVKTPERYTMNPADYRWLCRKCHIKTDGRGKRLAQSAKLYWKQKEVISRREKIKKNR